MQKELFKSFDIHCSPHLNLRFQQRHPLMFILQYPWMKHLSSIFSNETLKDSEEIIVPALPYLQNMTKVIKETPKR